MEYISRVFLSGSIEKTPELSHELFGERFYQGVIAVPRLSGAVDHLPFLAPEHCAMELAARGEASLHGQLRSYRRLVDGAARLQLMVFARRVGPPADEETNEVELSGTLLRTPAMRRTPLGREIADLLVAVQRPYGKKDCIPCIAWGKNAYACGGLCAGHDIALTGRLQSRVYQKALPDERIENRTTYEVSIADLSLPCGDSAR